MKDLLQENNQQKHLFKSYYCSSCKQVKPCYTIIQEYCCFCAYQIEKERGGEYSDYQLVYQRKLKEKREKFQQLQLLSSYRGCKECKECGSKEADAYFLYENNRLVCQPCRAKKDGGSSSPISFLEQSKWYKKHWRINLNEWLEIYQCLPVNAECAREWVRDKEHLNSCKCLEIEAQELYLLFANSLKKMEEELKECSCKSSEKVRVDSDYYAWCERCERSIRVASKKRVIKNRNDPKFWGLNIKEKVLCGDCLEKRKGEMTPLRRAKFNEYRNLGMI